MGITIARQDACVDEAETDQNGNMMIKVDSRYFRPIEVETLLGNSTKAKEKLSCPLKISLYEFVAENMRVFLYVDDMADASFFDGKQGKRRFV